MVKRGQTPSLIGSTAGAIKFVIAGGKRKCKRCDCDISKGMKCAEVGIPGTMGSKTYCLKCFRQILDKTREKLEALYAEL